MKTKEDWFIDLTGLPPFGILTDEQDAKILKFIEDVQRDAWIASAKAHAHYDDGTDLADDSVLPLGDTKWLH